MQLDHGSNSAREKDLAPWVNSNTWVCTQPPWLELLFPQYSPFSILREKMLMLLRDPYLLLLLLWDLYLLLPLLQHPHLLLLLLWDLYLLHSCNPCLPSLLLL